jgi:hypothetical protein
VIVDVVVVDGDGDVVDDHSSRIVAMLTRLCP